ncbi:ferritin-like domain-containing protein [Streptomyces sp. NPDC057540]|uniref:ferritin-like domain-containing protein n=1 Tax=Streptomyces sp. NPDC057540 TaxID=3346160 RepID=UPI0036A90324
MLIMTDIVSELRAGATISDVLRAQQSYHEYRRWSTDELFDGRRLDRPAPEDRAALWHAARAELTTQPAGIRLAVDGVKLAHELRESNPLGADVLHIAAAWSARYWLEEEAHHEVSFGRLMEMAGVDPIGHDEVVDHRGPFPTDNYARVCVLQACVEIEACVSYGFVSRTTEDGLVRDVFHTVMKDEVQHRQYFVSFAKALVESGVYPIKDVLSMAYTWIRPDGGETYGSSREAQTDRQGYVNWWEHLRGGEEEFGLGDVALHEGSVHSRKLSSVFALVREATGIAVTSYEDLKRAYFASLRTNDVDRIRSAVRRGAEKEAALAR